MLALLRSDDPRGRPEPFAEPFGNRLDGRATDDFQVDLMNPPRLAQQRLGLSDVHQRDLAGGQRRDLSEIDQRLTTFASFEAARTSALCNGRERDPYPADYELTLIRHEIWQAEELNFEIQARADQALEMALQVTSSVSDDPEYLKGFADGVQNMRFWSENDCDRLLSANFGSISDRPPKGSNRRYKPGYRDGQELIFNLILAKRLEGCYVPVPAMPE